MRVVQERLAKRLNIARGRDRWLSRTAKSSLVAKVEQGCFDTRRGQPSSTSLPEDLDELLTTLKLAGIRVVDEKMLRLLENQLRTMIQRPRTEQTTLFEFIIAWARCRC